MESNTLIDELRLLAQNDDALAVSREVNELKSRFDDLVLDLERKDQIAAMDAELKGEEHEPKDFKPLKDGFYEIYQLYRARRKEQTEAKKAVEQENLRHKQRLIERLKAVIQHEENIGAAFASQKEIHLQWKEIGDIPRDQRDTMQQNYSRLLEQFFYNINIYKELKDHDYKRNAQLKQEVIHQIQQLQSIDVIKDVENRLKGLQNEWDEIGPVPNLEWEALKNDYWDQVKAVYSRINAYYDDRRVMLQDRIAQKKVLVGKCTELSTAVGTYNNAKEWEEATELLVNLQAEWREIGPGPRKENEEVWQEFMQHCNEFYAAKKHFFEGIRTVQKTYAEQKQGLIDQAVALKDSTDWKETADKLIKLQQSWKKIGHAGQRQEQKLWAAFRTACDAFFNARQKHFEAKDKELEGNLRTKEEIIAKIQSYEPHDDRKQTLQDLKGFATTFNGAGMVPLKEKERIYKAFKESLDAQYSRIKLEGAEKEKVLYQARIETLSASPDAPKALSRERAELKQQIEFLRKDVLRYENNLGFFGRSKGAEKMKSDIEKKIQQTRDKMGNLQRRLKLIPHE